MNYKIFFDTQTQQFLANFEQKPALRPVVGDRITINESPIVYVITRDEEPNNGNGIVDVTHNYFVRVQNTSPDSISMGRDIQSVQNLLAKARHG